MACVKLMAHALVGLTLASCTILPGTQPAPTAAPPTALTPAEARSCPVAPGSPPLPDLANDPDPGLALANYLNAGGSIDRLEPWMPSGGLAPLQADVNGDGWMDWVVVILHSDALTIPPGGTLSLLRCSGSAYTLSFALTSTDRGAPVLHAAADLTGDGAADLLVGLPACGAHTCFEQALLLVWNGATLVDRLEGSSDDLPNPTYHVTPAGAGGSGRVEVQGTGVGSVGAGPYRPVVRTWSWDPHAQRFVVTRETTLPTNYRIHVLHDADRAYLEGDYALAQDLYHRVVTDDSLDDWEAGESGRQNMAAYATFRKVLTYLRMGDQGDAQVAYGILQNGYPEGSAGRGYAQMARAFWEEYGASNDLALACAAAQTFAQAHPTEILDPLYQGYANPTYTPQDVCPVLP